MKKKLLFFFGAITFSAVLYAAVQQLLVILTALF
jgi:hypothetical protein